MNKKTGIEPPPVAPRGMRNVRLVCVEQRHGADFAVMVRGMSASHESAKERGHHEMRAAVTYFVAKFCEMYDVSPSDLVDAAKEVNDGHV